MEGWCGWTLEPKSTSEFRLCKRRKSKIVRFRIERRQIAPGINKWKCTSFKYARQFPGVAKLFLFSKGLRNLFYFSLKKWKTTVVVVKLWKKIKRRKTITCFGTRSVQKDNSGSSSVHITAFHAFEETYAMTSLYSTRTRKETTSVRKP